MRKRLIGSGMACVLALLLLASTTVTGQDTTTMLSKFLVDLRAGTLGVANAISLIRLGDGTQTAPSVAFASETNKGFYSNAASQIAVSIGGTARHTFSAGGINNIQDTGIYTLGAAADWQLSRPAAGVLAAAGASGTNGIRLQFNGLPTAGTCGTSPSITAGSRDTAGSVNVGTGGTATACTVNFNATWASAPFCTANGTTTTPANVRAVAASASTTVLTLTAASAWVASEVVQWVCIGSK